MIRFVLAALLSGGAVAVSLASQAPATLTNSIDMEFVLIKPGTMQVGVFRPPYPKPVDRDAPSAARNDSPALTADEYARLERMAKADYREESRPQQRWTWGDVRDWLISAGLNRSKPHSLPTGAGGPLV